ncbi:hypothetical protein VO178_19600 [Lysinibacillus fusiformis]|uniref:hypothetical protein n=1 Tax=Lysinibacillus fusiformis TaxID=28031 RepID=UPI002D78148E|nr:hypothetical protein [Lysinibacillus fusiformis]WRS97561.1 hypothetical protein VO178_19600 [Lysinibacillus fusiformis]
MGQVYMQLEMERFIELKRAEEENQKFRKALEEIMEDQAPIMEGWETTTYEIAHKALGGEAHE